MFMSFINEGDPVPRADKAYIRSLIHLYISPPPGRTCPVDRLTVKVPKKWFRKDKSSREKIDPPEQWVWKWNVPEGTLSNAGRLVVLRDPPLQASGNQDDVLAELTCDQELRGVVFGDPMMHVMSLYAQRVETLATKGVAASIWT